MTTIERVTPEAYKPLLRVSRFLCIGSVVIGGGLAIDEPQAAVPFAMFGVLGLVWWILASSYTAGYETSAKHAALDAHRPARADEVPASIWAALPPAPYGCGHLYVIQFSSGTIKIGRTADPASRLRGHRRHGWAFGVVITRAWISKAHAEFEGTETELIDYAAATAAGDRARREFFHGADFDQLTRYAADLAGERLPG